MSREDFPLHRLVEGAEPPSAVVFGGPNHPDQPNTIRCSICGTPATDTDLPTQYANPVCTACDALAINDNGDTPWHGWPPGDEPDTEPGVIASPPDTGENPVFIAGAKCWRRYRFGGWITRRDAFDCQSLEQFRDRHRHDGTVIYAFNTPQPGGVDIPRTACEQSLSRQQTLKELRDDATHLRNNDNPDITLRDLSQRAASANISLPDRAPGPGASDPDEYAEAVADAADLALEENAAFADLCSRYYETV